MTIRHAVRHSYRARSEGEGRMPKKGRNLKHTRQAESPAPRLHRLRCIFTLFDLHSASHCTSYLDVCVTRVGKSAESSDFRLLAPLHGHLGLAYSVWTVSRHDVHRCPDPAFLSVSHASYEHSYSLCYTRSPPSRHRERAVLCSKR